MDLDGAEEYHFTWVDNNGKMKLQLTGKTDIVDHILVGYRSSGSFGNDAPVPVYRTAVNERKAFTVHTIWREPVDKHGGLDPNQPQEWVNFDQRTHYDSYSEMAAGKNGRRDWGDYFSMRFTQYQAAVKVDNAAMPAGGLGNLRQAEAVISAEGAVWSQRTFRQAFSEGGALAGRTVDDVALALRRGEMAAESLPIDMIERGGKDIF